MSNSFNLGWKFYKSYYKGSATYSLTDIIEAMPKEGEESKRRKDRKKKAEKIATTYFERLNESLFNFRLPENMRITTPGNYRNVQSFVLKTIYPGLLIGSGYTHGIGAQGEIKIGFYFDHTTGLPCLPGSSIKGIIRNAFEHYEDYVASEIEDLISIHPTEDQMQALVWEIFEGRPSKNEVRNVSCYHQDTFLEGIVIEGDQDGRLIGSDFITPHKNPLKNPVPIQFIKVLPNVQFEFAFQLNDSKVIPALTKEKKTELFQRILLDLGVGAKTNVGYGQFEEV